MKKIIKNTIRESDTAGRYGGEEFLIIFPGVDEKEGLIGAERIRESIEKIYFENGIKVSVSGGIAEYKGEDLVRLIDAADKKLYTAKEKGRNRIET